MKCVQVMESISGYFTPGLVSQAFTGTEKNDRGQLLCILRQRRSTSYSFRLFFVCLFLGNATSEEEGTAGFAFSGLASAIMSWW